LRGEAAKKRGRKRKGRPRLGRVFFSTRGGGEARRRGVFIELIEGEGGGGGGKGSSNTAFQRAWGGERGGLILKMQTEKKRREGRGQQSIT